MADFTGYNIQNVGTGKWVDLQGSNPADGTPLIPYGLNTSTTGSLNQQWRVNSVDAGVNLYTLQAVNPPSYAYLRGVAQDKTQLVGENISTAFEITQNNQGNFGDKTYTIRLPHTNLVWAVVDDKFVVQTAASGNKNQLFVFRAIQ